MHNQPRGGSETASRKDTRRASGDQGRHVAAGVQRTQSPFTDGGLPPTLAPRAGTASMVAKLRQQHGFGVGRCSDSASGDGIGPGGKRNAGHHSRNCVLRFGVVHVDLELVATILSALTGCSVSFQHKWSCEKNPRISDWIRDNFRVEHLFGDLLDLGNGHARDELTGRLGPVCSVDVLIAGFSCKDASRLNSHHGARLDAVEASSHTT